MEGLERIVGSIDGWRTSPGDALDALVRQVTKINGADLEDDVALLWLGST